MPYYALINQITLNWKQCLSQPDSRDRILLRLQKIWGINCPTKLKYWALVENLQKELDVCNEFWAQELNVQPNIAEWEGLYVSILSILK